MAFNIQSAGLLTTGTSNPDFFIVRSAAVPRTSIEGLAGNDTVQIVEAKSSATAIFVDVGADKDEIIFSAGGFEQSTFNGGAGADTLTVRTGTLFENTTIDAGLGDDVLNFASGGTQLSSRIVLGGGVDSIVILSGSVSNSFIGAGAGADVIKVGASGMTLAEIFGGGGNDSIFVSGIIGGAGGLDINGDFSGQGGGADTIYFGGAANVLSGSTIRGKGGKDVITVSGSIAGKASEVLGNAGADSITVLADMVGSGNLVGGGSGNDTIYFSGNSIYQDGSILGGGGADSITIANGVNLISGAIYGGPGADTISVTDLTTGVSFLSGDFGFAFSSLSDSTLSKMDIIDVGMLSGSFSGGMTFSVSAISKTLTTGIAAGVGFASTQEDGIIESGAFSAVGTTADALTARATLLDTQSNGLGETFFFEAENTQYLFIQGGSSGIDDDLLARISTGLIFGNAAVGFTSGKITLASS